MVKRDGGTYDLTEANALGYALAVLEAARDTGALQQLEWYAYEQGKLKIEWLDREPQPKGVRDGKPSRADKQDRLEDDKDAS